MMVNLLFCNDKQTIGGYTKIATVCKFDLPKLAQMKPQDTIQFKWISFQEAVDKNREQMSLFNEILKSHQKTPILIHLACDILRKISNNFKRGFVK